MTQAPTPTVRIRETLMGYEVSVNGIVVAGPYDTLTRARQAKKRLRREWTRRNRDTTLGGFTNG